MAADHTMGGWVQLIPRRERGQAGQTIRLPKPAADDRITWAQRPQYRGSKLVRVRVLVGEAGITREEDFQRGSVIDAPDELAEPRLKKGLWRLAPDEPLTAASE